MADTIIKKPWFVILSVIIIAGAVALWYANQQSEIPQNSQVEVQLPSAPPDNLGQIESEANALTTEDLGSDLEDIEKELGL